jgi:Amt family ammonium transporter
MVIGLLAGVICNLAARIIKAKFKIDDTLDVFACHGIGGTIGVICTGLFASKAINPAGADGLLKGGDTLFGANLTGAVAVAAYSVVATFIIIKLVNAISPVRVSTADEKAGLDDSQHGEKIHG